MAVEPLILEYRDVGAQTVLSGMREILGAGKEILSVFRQINGIRLTGTDVGLDRINVTIRRTRTEMGLLERILRAVRAGFRFAATTAGLFYRALGRVFNRVRLGIRNLTSLRVILTSVILGFGVRGVLRYADAWQNVENRIRPFVDSLEKTRAIQQALFESSQRTRQPLEESVNLFSRGVINQQALEKSTADLIRFTETVQKTLTLSGSTSGESQGALRQLSQLIGSPQIRGAGQELNSLQEQAPRLFKAILDGLGLTQQEFRKAASEGRIMAVDIINAIENVEDQINDEFLRVVPTIGQAFTTLRNSGIRAIGLISRSTGFGEALAGDIQEVSAAIDDLASLAVNASREIDSVVLKIPGSFRQKEIQQVVQITRELVAAVKESDTLRNSFVFQDPKRGLALQNVSVDTAFREGVDETFGGAGQTAGKIFLRTLELELRDTFVPAFTEIAVNLPIVFVGGLVSAFRGVVPELVKIVSAVVDQAFDVAQSRLGPLSGVLISENKSGDATARISTSLDTIFAEIGSQATTDVRDALASIGGGILRIRDNLATLRQEAGEDNIFAQLEDDVDSLPEKIVTLGERLDGISDFGDSFAASLFKALEAGASFAALGEDLSRGIVVGLGQQGADALVDFASGTKSAGDAFRDFASSVLTDIARMIAQFAILRLVSVGLSAAGFGLPAGLLGAAAGGAAASGAVLTPVPFARGGIRGGGAMVERPTAFPMSGGRYGIMGERGREGIFPIEQTSDGTLGIRGSAGGGAPPYILNAIGDDEISRMIRTRGGAEEMGRQIARRGSAANASTRRTAAFGGG